MSEANGGKKYEHDQNGQIPVMVQPACKPDKARLIDYLPENFTADAVVAHLKDRLAAENSVIDAKLIRSKKNGNRWSVVVI